MGRGGYVLGGLLAGIGQGLAKSAAEKREDALNTLRRSQKLEDDASEEQRDIRKEGRDAELKVGLLTLANKYKKEEGETEQAYAERLENIRQGHKLEQIGAQGTQTRLNQAQKTALDKTLEGYKFDNELEKLEVQQAFENGEVQSTLRGADGSLIVMFKGGKKVRLNEKIAPSGNSSSGTTSVIDTVRGGDTTTTTETSATKPKPPEKPKGKVATAADLAQLYADAGNAQAAGDPRFRGLSAAQVKAAVDASLKAQGYTIQR